MAPHKPDHENYCQEIVNSSKILTSNQNPSEHYSYLPQAFYQTTQLILKTSFDGMEILPQTTLPNPPQALKHLVKCKG